MQQDDDYLVSEGDYPLHPPDFAFMDAVRDARIDILQRVSRSYKIVDMAIHKDDEMWNGLAAAAPTSQRPYMRLHYSYGGRSAMSNIANALVIAQLGPPKRILDFPSSHGRVTRYLVKAFPEAEVIAGDVNRGGVDFCASRFGATPFYSDYDLDSVTLPGNLDLIWCSSLVTHLKPAQCEQLFHMLIDALAPNGILGITWCSRAMDYTHDHVFKTINEEAMVSIRAQVNASGVGYAPYPGWPNDAYGMTFVTLAWLQNLIYKRPDAYVLSFGEKSWHTTQDTLWMIKRPLSHWYNWDRDD